MSGSDLDLAIIQPITIIVVDDDQDDLIFINDAFSSIGFKGKLEFFDEGKKLLETLEVGKTSLAHLFIIDLNMPVFNGFELITHINYIPPYKDIPKIILSTSNNPNFIQKSKELDCIAYFQKPDNFKKYSFVARQILNEFHTYDKK
jgi:CheY-like chemotaxis protein